MRRRELTVWLQPQISPKENRIAGAEILIRWKHPVKGIILPGEFLPQVSRYDLMEKIDRFVFEQTCRVLGRLCASGYDKIRLSVNLSEKSLEAPGILGEFTEVCNRYRVQPEKITLELVENIAAEQGKKLEVFIKEASRRGFRCAIDDFGAGYSSLGRLKKLEVDCVKLDRSFFERSSVNGRGEIILSYILQMCHGLGMEVVAEGIEEEKTVTWLEEKECDLIQGFVYAPPLAEEEFMKFMKQYNNQVR